MNLFTQELSESNGLKSLLINNDTSIAEAAKLNASNDEFHSKYASHDKLKHKHGFYGFVVCECNDVEFVMFHLNDDVVAWQFFWLGAYESKLMNEFYSYLDNTDLFLDVGAYTGCFSLVAAKKGVNVNAFEMVPRTVERLKINVIANNLQNKINIHDFGVSDKNSSVEISMPRDVDFLGTGNSVTKKESVTSVASTTCNVRKLNDWWKEQGAPDIQLLKLDVEEHEFEALTGMDELVDQCRPTFLIEIARSQKEDVVSYLNKFGYKLENIEGLNYVARARS